MKKVLALLLALAMVFALAACGGSGTNNNSGGNDSSNSNSGGGSSTNDSSTNDSSTNDSNTGDSSNEEVSVPTTVAEAQAQGRQVIVMNNHNSKESSNGQFTQCFVDYVNETSKTLYIDVYYNGELGGIQETLEGAIMGTIDLGGCSFAQLASFYPDIEVWSMPYLYTDPYEGAKIVDLEKNTLLADMIDECNESAGITIFALTYSIDARQLTCNFPVYSPADLAGEKIRCITNPVYTMCIQGMGGTPVPIDWTETIAALSSGTVVGEENPYATLVSYQLWDCQDYVMETNHLFDFGVSYICTDTWNTLSAEDQQILRDGVAAQQALQNQVLEEGKEEYKQTLVENGMTIITADDGLDLDAFKAGVDALKETQYPQYADYFAFIDDYLANY